MNKNKPEPAVVTVEKLSSSWVAKCPDYGIMVFEKSSDAVQARFNDAFEYMVSALKDRNLSVRFFEERGKSGYVFRVRQ